MKLEHAASFIKSANAGASQLTFDIGFADAERFRAVVASGAVSREAVATRYRIRPEDVAIHPYTPASTIKITIPRPVISGGIEERDFDGVQQFIPLLDIEIPGL